MIDSFICYFALISPLLFLFFFSLHDLEEGKILNVALREERSRQQLCPLTTPVLSTKPVSSNHGRYHESNKCFI